MEMTKRPLYQAIASAVQARLNCLERMDTHGEWFGKHTETIQYLVHNYMPSGCGIDCGTKIDLDASKPNRLVFNFSYHHMDENGFYDGWTDHQLIVTPSLQFGISLRITGPDRNDVKDYLYDTYQWALVKEVNPYPEVEVA